MVGIESSQTFRRDGVHFYELVGRFRLFDNNGIME